MKYMLLTYLDEKTWLSLSPEQQRHEMELCGPHVQKLLASKKRIDGAPVHATTSATTLRFRDGKRVITDGPSQVIDVGRQTKVIPKGLWRALVARDGGCVAPGCDRP